MILNVYKNLAYFRTDKIDKTMEIIRQNYSTLHTDNQQVMGLIYCLSGLHTKPALESQNLPNQLSQTHLYCKIIFVYYNST